MKQKKRFLFLTFFFCTWLVNSSSPNGPDGFINSGGTGSISPGQLLGSIAEPVTGLLKDGWQHCLQGFVYKTIATDFATGVDGPALVKQLKVSIYPNPVKGFMYVKLDGGHNQQFNYSIFSQDGHLVKNGPLEGGQARVNVSGLASAPYLFILASSPGNVVLDRSKILILK